MTILVPIAEIDHKDAAWLEAVLGNLLYWIRHDPKTQEEYEASMAALADVDKARCYLREMQKGAL